VPFRDNNTDSFQKKDGIQPLSSLGWHHVCPPRKRKYLQISPSDFNKAGPNPGLLMNTWIENILKQDARCIEITGEPFPDRYYQSVYIV
jgi:hypothetical protein